MDFNGHRILTADGGEFAITHEMRQFMAFLDDGRLLVSKAHTFNPHVRGFIGRLDRQKRAYTTVPVEISILENIYAGAEAETSKAAHSDMQKVATTLFAKAVDLRASDIHMRVSTRSKTKIYCRVHNDLEFVEEQTYEFGFQLCSTIYQAMSNVSDPTFEAINRQDARISDRDKLPAKLDGIRIATTPQVDGFVMVLRLLYNDTNDNLDISALGYEEIQVESVELMKKRPTGIVIIGGPTGSGKSTTLQRVLSSVIKESKGRKHIITVEDPPEYPIPGAVQTPVTNADDEEERSKAFQKAIRATMRLDPDVIMIGEVRDAPSAKLAIQGAMTGHQVWTTLHANSAFAIISRLVDLGVPLELIADPSIISGLVCQRLLKVLCPQCKISLTDTKAQKRYKPADLDRIMGLGAINTMYVCGEGCDHCRSSGTIGRTVVAETVTTEEELMAYIRKGDRLGAINYWKEQMGGISMTDHAISKVLAGMVDPFQAEDIVGSLVKSSVYRG